MEYYLRTPPELVEMVENRTCRQALKLFRRIVDELDPSDFTLKEIRESFNSKSDTDPSELKVRYGQSHLNYLERKELIQYDGDNCGEKHYYVVRLIDLEK